MLRRLETAFEDMNRKGLGFPRFKKFGRMRSFVFPQFKDSPLRVDWIKLPALGWTKMILSRPVPEGFILKQVRIVKKASGYFAMLSLQCEVSVPDAMPQGHPLGIDLGLETFAATSDGELIARPRFFNQLHCELKLLQRRLKHKKRWSKNWLKLNQKIARLHQRISDTRKDFHFKTAHHICNQAGQVFIEDLDFRIMAKGMLGKHTLDAGFGQFANILKWVCFKRQTYFGLVDARGTSQTCPQCGTYTPKDLSVRVHDCIECGYTTNRDVAAAQVIVKRGTLAAGQAVSQIVCRGDGTGASSASLAPTRRGRKPRQR